MRSGPGQRPRGRFNANRPFEQQPRGPQNNQTFDSNGPNIKIRGSAHQIFERYIALAREATASGDRVAAENFYQHAEHYFRIDNARRGGDHQGTQQQRAAIARVLAQESRVILADEPVASLDPTTAVSVLSLLRDIAHDRRITVLCSLHQIDLVPGFGSGPGFACWPTRRDRKLSIVASWPRYIRGLR